MRFPPPLKNPELTTEAVDKVLERADEFKANGWTKPDLFGLAPRPYGYHGLAYALKPHHDIGRIWPNVAEVLGRIDGRGERSILHHWRGSNYFDLCHQLGRDNVVPIELEWLPKERLRRL